MPARNFAGPTGRRRRTAVAELTPQDMAAKLLATGFERSGPSAATLSDPIADTPMMVTLNQLRPYDHDPRVTRNPAYAEIKASIRSEEHTSEVQSLMRISYAVFCLKKKKNIDMNIDNIK